MMNRFKQTISLGLMLAMLSIGLTAQAQRPRLNNYQLDQLIRSVEDNAARFNSSLNTALSNYSYNSPRRAENVNTYVSDFNRALSQLRTRFNRRMARAADVQLVLDRASLIDNFMNRNQLDPTAESDWANERAQLNQLASAYGIYWRTGSETAQTAPYPADNPPYRNNQPYNRGGYGNAQLTGTFSLDSTQSDNARRQAEIAARTVPYARRQQVIDNLMRRLEAPDQIAIERRGRTVTIASTRAPQITFEADGVQRTETMPSGRTVRTVATLNGNQLAVSTTGDRGNDFNVTFEPADYGRRLYVTRRISDINMTQPVTVRSVYTRTSDVAQFDIYNGSQYPNNAGYGTTANGSFIIPDNTVLVATLDNDLSTRNTREGDRFTMTVRDPSQYAGAIIEGTVGRVDRSGRISGRSQMSLNLDTIRLRDGSSYRFGGVIESVRTTNGEQARVDNEGTVQEGGNSRGETTAQRAAIGTAVGAIIGAIAGGGKGAAIGAILGAGGGAGSVYVQGSDDLDLTSGTELTIRSSAPVR